MGLRQISRTALLVACVVGLSGAWLKADETGPVPTNMNFLIDLVKQDLQGELNRLGINQTQRLTIDTLYLQSARTTSSDWLLEYVLIDILGKKNIMLVKGASGPALTQANENTAMPRDTTRAKDSSNTAAQKDSAAVPTPAAISVPHHHGFRLNYRVIDCNVVYAKIWRESLVGAKKIERQGTIRAFLELVNLEANTIVWQYQMNSSGTDVVPYASKSFIENSDYNFVKTNTIRPYWKEFLEITLAGGSVGYILYLFFSQSFN
jgi:hypothetical protein